MSKKNRFIGLLIVITIVVVYAIADIGFNINNSSDTVRLLKSIPAIGFILVILLGMKRVRESSSKK